MLPPPLKKIKIVSNNAKIDVKIQAQLAILSRAEKEDKYLHLIKHY